MVPPAEIRKFAPSSLGPFLLFAFPFLGLVGFVWAFAVNVPIGDEWGLVPLFLKLHRGTATLGDLFRVHNEHRILFPKLIFCLVAFTTGWNIKVLLSVSVLLAGISGWLLFRMANGRYRAGQMPPFRTYALAVTSFHLFSWVQYENWLWGFQVSWLLVNACFVAAWFCLIEGLQRRRRMAGLAAIFCLIASFSSGQGLVTWFALLPLVVRVPSQTKKRIKPWMLWILAGIMVCGLYAIHYTSPPKHPSLRFAIERPLTALGYYLAVLGGPLASSTRPATIFLLAGLAVAVLISCQLYREVTDGRGRLRGLRLFLMISIASALVLSGCFLASYWPAPSRTKLLNALLAGTLLFYCFSVFFCFSLFLAEQAELLEATGWLSLGLFPLAFAVLVTIGRSGFGMHQALASRYSSASVFLLISGVQLLCFCIYRAKNPAGKKWNLSGSFLPAAFLLASFLGCLGASVPEALAAARANRTEMLCGQYGLELISYLDTRPGTRHVVDTLHSTAGYIKKKAALLQESGVRNFTRYLNLVPNSAYVAGAVQTVSTARDRVQVQGTIELSPVFKGPLVILFSLNERRSFFHSFCVPLHRTDKGLRQVWTTTFDAGLLVHGRAQLHAWCYSPKDKGIVALGDVRTGTPGVVD